MNRYLAAILAYCLTGTIGQDIDTTVKNANHIFNEIHSSARQWGSTLNHNGMAFFVANVPEGTELYHGTGSTASKKGMDWLAFEPEHALVFARPGSNRVTDEGTKDAEKEVPTYGYLHTYRTQHDLRLLYLDGAAAAKSDRGTLDLQEIVLLQGEPRETFGRRSYREHEEDLARATGMCRMAQHDWKGRIDGFIRMEAGFEIILCDFEAHVVSVRCTQSKAFDAKPGMIPDSPAFFKAVSGRYDGIGGDRIRVDYDCHVSLFAFPDAVYYDKFMRPRVNYTSTALDAVRKAVTAMALGVTTSSTRHTSWQEVADMTLSRYADRISYLASGELTSLTELRLEAERSLRPFIDYSHLNKSAEVARCKDHFIPWARRQSSSTAAIAIAEVTTLICETLSRIAHSKLQDYSHGLSLARALKSWLAWTEWKKCKGCQPNEFCFIPLWPLGSAEDFEAPRCVSNFKGVGRDYWHREGPERKKHTAAGFSLAPGYRGRIWEWSNGTCPAIYPVGTEQGTFNP